MEWVIEWESEKKDEKVVMKMQSLKEQRIDIQENDGNENILHLFKVLVGHPCAKF